MYNFIRTEFCNDLNKKAQYSHVSDKICVIAVMDSFYKFCNRKKNVLVVFKCVLDKTECTDNFYCKLFL